MKVRISAALLSVITAFGLGSAGFADAALANGQPAVQHVQYDRYPDERGGYYAPEPPPYRGERRDGYAYPPRDAYDRDYPLWRPGDVLPGELLNFVVDDWEPRGLERPPGGHLWVRVRDQFILVRERDRMISRVINFG